MKVIRMEDRHGRGMYTSFSGSSSVIGSGLVSDAWPMARDDSKLQEDIGRKMERHYSDYHLSDYNIRDLYRFCFGSYEQMERWIYNFDWRVALAEYTIKLNVYEVDDDWVMIGTTQCTFRLDKATLVGSFCPTTLKQDLPL